MKKKDVEEFYRRLQAENPEPKGELNYVNPYTLLVAVVLSAQATDVGVNKATQALFRKVKTPEQMKKANPEKLFKQLHVLYPKVDLCELYVFRGAVLDIPWWECKNLDRKHKLKF